MDAGALRVDAVLQGPPGGFKAVKVPGEGPWCQTLTSNVMEVREILVLDGFSRGNPLVRHLLKTSADQIETRRRRSRKALLQGLAWLLRQRQCPEHSLDLSELPLWNPREVPLLREPKGRCNLSQHVHMVIAREQSFTRKELCMDAAYRPEVHRDKVARRLKHELRSSVPSRHDIVSERVIFVGATPGKAKVCNPQGAVLVHKDVRRL
mmetsp:Transcript_35694/g.82978  ORF Transcript_35694/g.82978 Transcript_35694/m.82978 type:complete len:208 (+) Transcript_35694:249-872(+)